MSSLECVPFLLNVTINHHIETYQSTDPSVVDHFLSSIYVDDLSTDSDDMTSTYDLYLKSKLRLTRCGFKLRKFATNSEGLRDLIAVNEQQQPAKCQTLQLQWRRKTSLMRRGH